MAPEPALESPFASIRELTAAKDEIMKAVRRLGEDLRTEMREGARTQANVCATRHAPLDEHMRRVEAEEDQRTGVRTVLGDILKVLRLVREFAPLFAAAGIFMGFLLGNIRIAVGG
jgi:fructose-1,6-bisphosphatase/sedoheptulose 1,7-bisphosphatase-like protein